MRKVIYMTGAPASGKSSTTRLLTERVDNVAVWEYGARLTEYISAFSREISSQNELCTRSAGVITHADIVAVDRLMLEFVTEHRGNQHIIIDSHAVTKESYGFRITPFSLENFAILGPNEIWLLSASPETVRRRIGEDDGGRPMVSEEEARMHTFLQASVAATYAMSLGIPCYIFDTDRPREKLLAELASRLA